MSAGCGADIYVSDKDYVLGGTRVDSGDVGDVWKMNASPGT